MSEKKKRDDEVVFEGEVIDSTQNGLHKIGGSYHNRIPMPWYKRFGNAVLEIKLIKEQDGSYSILIQHIKEEKKNG